MSKTFATQCRLLPSILAELKTAKEDDDDDDERMEHDEEEPLMAPFRYIVIRSKPLAGSDGSSSVQMGNTRVLCSVNGPREQQSSSSSDSAALEGILGVSLHGYPSSVDPALRYTIEHALQAAVRLRKLARTEIDIELNVLSDDGGALAACLLAAGVALASANIEMFDIVLACNVLLIPSLSSSSESPMIIVDPDQARIAAHAGRAAQLTMAVMPSIGQVVCSELSANGCPLPQRQLRLALPTVFEHCLALYGPVREAMLKTVAEEAL